MRQNDQGLHLADAIMHELKTALTAIIVSAELLASEIKPEDKSVLGRLIQSVIRNARSIDERISLLSEAEGLLADNSRFQPESVNIQEITQNIVTQLYPEIQSKKQTISLDIPDNLPPARADRQYLEQILLTLLSNAIKFTGEEGIITVSSYREGINLVMQVKDNGMGIPEDEQEKVFQPYYQVNLGKSSPSGESDDEGRYRVSGQGLGLAIARFLIELHGGKIWLESKSGQGSTFSFSLPMAVSVESSSD